MSFVLLVVEWLPMDMVMPLATGHSCHSFRILPSYRQFRLPQVYCNRLPSLVSLTLICPFLRLIKYSRLNLISPIDDFLRGYDQDNPFELVLYHGFPVAQGCTSITDVQRQELDYSSGITAPLVVLLRHHIRQKLGRTVMLAWNLLCLALLINVVVHGIPVFHEQIEYGMYFPCMATKRDCALVLARTWHVSGRCSGRHKIPGLEDLNHLWWGTYFTSSLREVCPFRKASIHPHHTPTPAGVPVKIRSPNSGRNNWRYER